MSGAKMNSYRLTSTENSEYVNPDNVARDVFGD